MTDERPGFTHKRERHGLIGPFSGRQLLAAAVAIALVAVIGVAITTPLGNTSIGPDVVNPQATPFIIGEAPAEGLRPGMTAPELEALLDDGTTYQLTDLDGQPIRLDQLRGKVVWLNFWASWCPPCQQETPILRELHEKYHDRGPRDHRHQRPGDDAGRRQPNTPTATSSTTRSASTAPGTSCGRTLSMPCPPSSSSTRTASSSSSSTARSTRRGRPP